MSRSYLFPSRFLVVGLLILFSQLPKVTSVDEIEQPSHLRGSIHHQADGVFQNDAPSDDVANNFWNTFDDATLNDGNYSIILL